MTLNRMCLDFSMKDLPYRFGVSPSLATSIVRKFFLSLELEPLIYSDLPSPGETLFWWNINKCEGIGDCTEQYIEHSQTSDAQ